MATAARQLLPALLRTLGPAGARGLSTEKAVGAAAVVGAHTAQWMQVRWNSTETERFVPVAEHERAMKDMSSKFDKDLMEQNHRRFEHSIVALRYELKKAADDQMIQHCKEIVNIRNEFKALEYKFSNLEERFTQHLISFHFQTLRRFSKAKAKWKKNEERRGARIEMTTN